MIRSAAFHILPCALVLLAARPAFSQPKSESESTKQFRLGVEAVKQGHSEEARMRFRDSYALDPKPSTLKNLALAESELPEFRVLALVHLREWVRRSTSISPADQERANQVLNDLRAQTGHITVVGVLPEAVTIDAGNGASVTEEGGTFDVLPGHHKVSIDRGSSVDHREVDVGAGTNVQIRLADERALPAPAAPPPTANQAAAPTSVSVREDVPPPGAEHSRASVPSGAWILGGSAVAAAAVGVVFALKAGSTGDDAAALASSLGNHSATCAREAGLAECGRLADLRSSYTTQRAVEAGMFIGAGVLAAGAVTWWYVAGRSERAPRAQLAPLLAPGVAGAFFETKF